VTRTALALVLLLPSIALAQPAPVAEPSTVAQQAASPSGYFQYDLRRSVHGGRFAYAGYSDELVANGRYDVSTEAAERGAIHAVYHWRFDSSDRHERGEEDRTVAFALPDRHYVGDRTDLDDYDRTPAFTLATWVWIPPDVEVGASVTILERVFTVVSVGDPVDVAGAPRSAISLSTTGTGSRLDDYGSYSTTFTDQYWFDRATGMFLREQYEEHDDGTFEGEHAAFDVTEHVMVIDASYAPHVGELPHDPVAVAERTEVVATSYAPRRSHTAFWLGLGIFGALAISFVYFVYSRASKNHRPTIGGKPIDLEALATDAALPALPPETTAHFGPFLAHFTELARRTKNEIVVARASGQPLGIGFADRDTAVASIFAPSPEICEQLRKQLGATEFFSELRHGNVESVMAASATTGERLNSSHAYNVYETYEVLRLDAIPPSLSFDSAVVTRLRESDVPEATALLDAVLGVPCRAFLDASLALGDVGYAARVDGRIVAVGLASLAGTTGRLHTLAVHPDHRAKGLGKELVRARLRALSELGATRVITEIATWNLASLEIARANGFQKVSEMFVESARDQKVEKRLVRR
jgi:GNAT superfamily N-acetyltransferase